VNVGNRKNPSYLPAEVCVVIPGQNSRSKLNPLQTKKMIEFAVRKPYDNTASIVQEGPRTIGLLPRDNPLLVRLLFYLGAMSSQCLYADATRIGLVFLWNHHY
jgi:eukaryotic translation initiation factor 2C